MENATPEAVAEVAEEVEQVDERVANLEVVVQDLKTELAEAKTELETMKAQTPKATVISRMPKMSTMDFSKMTPLERYRFSKKQ
jgi:phage shock protein A